MSYCRTGADSDVYVYAMVGDKWAIHVAHSKDREGAKRPTWPGNDATDSEKARYFVEFEDTFEPIVNPYAGKSYTENSERETIERLEKLRRSGLRVPQRAIDRLRQEQKGGKVGA